LPMKLISQSVLQLLVLNRTHYLLFEPVAFSK
jgi:hypothetical protein